MTPHLNLLSNNSKTIVFIGNGDSNTDATTKLLSKNLGMPYRGVMSGDTIKQDGVYHTSSYDIKAVELKLKLDSTDTIVVLDFNDSDFSIIHAYYETLDLAESMIGITHVNFLNDDMRNSFRNLLKENKSFCIYPFIALYKKGDSVCSCCKMTSTITDTYTDFTNDPDISLIRQKMIKGELIESHCNACYRLEKIGAPSSRQVATAEWTTRLKIKSLNDLTRYTEPIFIDIRLNNKCNAMCRFCGPESSNLIDKEYFKLQLRNDSIGITEDPNYDSINLNHIQRMYVAGGEPSINQYFLKFLSRCIEQDNTNFELLINTNAATISEKFAALISKFSNVSFLISVDAAGDLNNYIRYPIMWDKLTRNIKLLDRIADGRITFNSVISIYNGGELFPLFNFLQSKYPHARNSVSILSWPAIQRIDNFPNKVAALADLEKVKTLGFYKKYSEFRCEIDSIINLIKTTDIDSTALEKFFEFNDKLDKSRNMNLRDYNPILHNAR